MRTYTVIWFYIANHGCYRTEAVSSNHACRRVIEGFNNPEFTAKAKLLAFEGVHNMTSAEQFVGGVG